MATETYTTLNPGASGDKMDESSVTQSDLTATKRPNIVIGGPAGYGTVNDLVQPVAVEPASTAMMLPVVAGALVSDLPQMYVVGELRPLSVNADGRLRTTSVGADVHLDHFGDTRALATDPDDFNHFTHDNPWGL